MLEELSIVRLASAMARHASARHGVIAQNIANADTPGYAARDVRKFADYVNEGFTAKATRVAHLSRRDVPHMPQAIADPAALTSPNGNSVSLDGEMVKSVEAQGQHAMAQAVYRKMHEFMRLGLGRGR